MKHSENIYIFQINSYLHISIANTFNFDAQFGQLFTENFLTISIIFNVPLRVLS